MEYLKNPACLERIGAIEELDRVMAQAEHVRSLHQLVAYCVKERERLSQEIQFIRSKLEEEL